MNTATGRYIDNPEQREAVWKNAPKAVDQFGNKLVKIGHYWCSSDFQRFWDLAIEESEDSTYIVVVRVSDGRFFSRPRSSIRRAMRYWKRRMDTGWYGFVDPVIQVTYQE